MTSYSVSSLFVIFLLIVEYCVRAYNYPYLNPANERQYTYLQMPFFVEAVPVYNCIINNIWTDCPVIPSEVILNKLAKEATSNVRDRILGRLYQLAHHQVYSNVDSQINQHIGAGYPRQRERLSIPKHPLNTQAVRDVTRTPLDKNSDPDTVSSPQLHYRRFMHQNKKDVIKKLHGVPNSVKVVNTKITERPRAIDQGTVAQELTTTATSTVAGEYTLPENTDGTVTELYKNVTTLELTDSIGDISTEISNYSNSSYDKFIQSLDTFERKFYELTFNKLASISPVERRENGISFLQSGLFLHLVLTSLSLEVDSETRAEIDKCIGLNASDVERIEVMKRIVSSLPVSNGDLKFRWASRLVLGKQPVSQEFQNNIASITQLQLNHLNGTRKPDELVKILNAMVEKDSGKTMHDTFEEDELSEGVSGVLLNTIYLRGRWRASPTLLNGTRLFRDADDAPRRFTRMIRINDMMRYADIQEWDAEALEISYATPGLSLLVVIPRGRSLRTLTARVAATSLHSLKERMRPLRVAVSLPLYTLRMTLLLPAKLESMGISRLVNTAKNVTRSESFVLSHAVQRLMFWSEAGRNAFKDDGIEWDARPELELMVDRPYIFFVRWQNCTLVNGNFVL